MRTFAILAVLLIVIGAGVVQWANSAWTEPGPPARQGNQTVILIAPHTRVHDIVQHLADQGVVHAALLFEANLRLRRMAERVKAGEYAIPSHATMAEVAAILVAGKSIQHKLTAAEGLTSQMIYDLVVHDPALIGDAGPVPAEGSLLPETYLFIRGETRSALLEKMARAQEKFLAAQWPVRSEGLPIRSVKAAIILASIVEKETALPEERRHIAGAFVNRLKLGMKLQSDPTIIYDISKGYPLGRGIRQSELTGATPYNTYVIAGLPPGPICNPGKDSIAAVLNPETTGDLYFVASGKGGHVFSSTIAEHDRNVAAFRARERMEQLATPDIISNTVPLPDATLPALRPSETVPQRHSRHRARRHG